MKIMLIKLNLLCSWKMQFMVTAVLSGTPDGNRLQNVPLQRIYTLSSHHPIIRPSPSRGR